MKSMEAELCTRLEALTALLHEPRRWVCGRVEAFGTVSLGTLLPLLQGARATTTSESARDIPTLRQPPPPPLAAGAPRPIPHIRRPAARHLGSTLRQVARDKLEAVGAFVRLCEEVDALRTYALLNLLAATKLVQKHDRLSPILIGDSVMSFIGHRPPPPSGSAPLAPRLTCSAADRLALHLPVAPPRRLPCASRRRRRGRASSALTGAP